MQLAPINHIEIRNGVPVIAETGHKVALIAPAYVRGDASIEWIVENFDLTLAQVHAAISYYYDHAEEIEQYLREGDDLARRVGISSEEHLEEIRRRKRGDRSDV